VAIGPFYFDTVGRQSPASARRFSTVAAGGNRRGLCVIGAFVFVFDRRWSHVVARGLLRFHTAKERRKKREVASQVAPDPEQPAHGVLAAGDRVEIAHGRIEAGLSLVVNLAITTPNVQRFTQSRASIVNKWHPPSRRRRGRAADHAILWRSEGVAGRLRAAGRISAHQDQRQREEPGPGLISRTPRS
jgi:hypothetical protein